jgi:hypothetical protein
VISSRRLRVPTKTPWQPCRDLHTSNDQQK